MLEILLADDEPTIRLSVGDALSDAGHRVTLAADGEKALQLCRERIFDLVISDIRMPRASGLDVLDYVRRSSPGTEVILITAYGDVKDAVSALKSGCFDYIIKPFDNEEIQARVARVDEKARLSRDLEEARRRLRERRPSCSIIGQSPAMIRLLKRIETIATSDLPVMVTGPSGSGKELVAKRLHELSDRRDAPFVPVNCSAFPESLLESELFGHEKGAFTGAIRSRDGRFKIADGGTLFLDEIGEIPPLAQVKLLRAVQEGTIEPLGSHVTIKVDVRIVAATHRNLKERMKEGLFREDLYYRVNVLDIEVPPLRDRPGDLPLLVEHFLHRNRKKDGPTTCLLSPRAWAALSHYSFPGNVRELEHAIEHARVLCGGEVIGLEHLPRDLRGRVEPGEAEGSEFRPLSPAVREFERHYIVRALRLSGGKKSEAARLLGISRKNLWEKVKGHGILEHEY